MDNIDFNIKRINGTIILEKGDKKLKISQALDDDIWFATAADNLELKVDMYSRDYSELQTYRAFDRLITFLFGKYISSGDYSDENSILPQDFMNLENSTITLKCDGGSRNTLQLSHENKSIKIRLIKDSENRKDEATAVRIRTNGSTYGYYYQEFMELFTNLREIEYSINSSSGTNIYPTPNHAHQKSKIDDKK